MREKINSYKIVVRTLEGQRLLGIHKCTWEKSIILKQILKLYAIALKCGLDSSGADTDQWRTDANTDLKTERRFQILILKLHYLRYELLTASKMSIVVFRIVTSSGYQEGRIASISCVSSRNTHLHEIKLFRFECFKSVKPYITFPCYFNLLSDFTFDFIRTAFSTRMCSLNFFATNT